MSCFITFVQKGGGLGGDQDEAIPQGIFSVENNLLVHQNLLFLRVGECNHF